MSRNSLIIDGNLSIADKNGLDKLSNAFLDYKQFVKHPNLPKQEMERVQNLWEIPKRYNKTLLCIGGVEESIIKKYEQSNSFNGYRVDRDDTTNVKQEEINCFLKEEEIINKENEDDLYNILTQGSHIGFTTVLRTISKEYGNLLLFPIGSYGLFGYSADIQRIFST